MAACARLQSSDGGAEPPHVPKGEEARAGAEPQPQPAGQGTDDTGEERDSAPTPALAREIGTGPEAVSLRRRALAASDRALDPESLGYFMDVHEARLLQSLGESVRLRREDSEFHLRISGRAGFASGSTQLNSNLQRDLQAIAEVLVEFDRTLIVVHAHTDASGPAEYNQVLSEDRALRVSQTLVDNGVDPRRLVAVGHGEMQPIAGNDTAAGRARNRRVDVVIEAIESEPPG